MSDDDGGIEFNQETLGLLIIATGVAFGFMVVLTVPESMDYYLIVKYGGVLLVAVWTTYIYRYVMDVDEDGGAGGAGEDTGTRRGESDGGDGLLGRFQN